MITMKNNFNKVNELIELYNSRLSLILISKHFKITKATIKEILKDNNIKIREYSEAKRYTLEKLIQDIGKIPICKCPECQITKTKVVLHPDKRNGSYIKYKHSGYPRFIRGHGSRVNSGMYKPEIHKTYSEMIEILGEPPICGCDECQISGQRININPKCYTVYKRLGYPKFLPGHNSKCKDSKSIITKHLSEESKKKRSESRKEYFKNNPDVMKKENNPAWQGGLSFLPYCPKFDDIKREETREKYYRKCIICGKPEYDNIITKGKKKGTSMKLTVHHIDYNKLQGCEGHEWKLAPLCMQCHAKTNRNRIEWETKISEMIFIFEKIDFISHMFKCIEEISKNFYCTNINSEK